MITKVKSSVNVKKDLNIYLSGDQPFKQIFLFKSVVEKFHSNKTFLEKYNVFYLKNTIFVSSSQREKYIF